MSSNWLVLLEGGLVFGLAIGFGVRELSILRRERQSAHDNDKPSNNPNPDKRNRDE